MALYDFSCQGCGSKYEQQAPMGTEVLPCLKCGQSAFRQFSPTRNIAIPLHFRSARGWHLPPRDSKRWETMVAPGSEKKTVKEQTLREYCREQGIRGA